MNTLFGTDGIRGVAGKFPLTEGDVRRLGAAAGRVLLAKCGKGPCRILAVRDTRESGTILLHALTAGLRATGVDVYDAGVLSTPSAAFLVQAHRFQSGVVISASHNPPQFNGIKFFTAHGRKWPDAWEREVERAFARLSPDARFESERGSLVPAAALAEDYLAFLVRSLGSAAGLAGLRVAVDCSNGANFRLAPEVFRRLGVTVHVIGDKPNGKNINVGCGSQSLARLSAVVRRNRCSVGVAFDGDGDRVIFVDEKGQTVDGDHIIALMARYLKRKGRLKKGLAVVTVMANIGLRKALARINVRSVETPVGDRHVSEAMRKHGAVLGGEQSGHIILGDHLPTGDGLLTALHVLKAFAEQKEPFSRFAGWMKKYPQVLLNVTVKERRPLDTLDGVSPLIRSIEKGLGKNGRVLVRYSGTEPLLRIMLEGPKRPELDRYASEIASAVKAAMP